MEVSGRKNTSGCRFEIHLHDCPEKWESNMVKAKWILIPHRISSNKAGKIAKKIHNINQSFEQLGCRQSRQISGRGAQDAQ